MRKSPSRKGKAKGSANSNKKAETPQKSKGSSKRKAESPPVSKNSNKNQKSSKQGSSKQTNNLKHIGTRNDSEKNIQVAEKVK